MGSRCGGNAASYASIMTAAAASLGLMPIAREIFGARWHAMMGGISWYAADAVILPALAWRGFGSSSRIKPVFKSREIFFAA